MDYLELAAVEHCVKHISTLASGVIGQIFL